MTHAPHATVVTPSRTLRIAAACCLLCSAPLAHAAAGAIVSEPIGDRIVRYYPSEDARVSAFPSMALQAPAVIAGNTQGIKVIPQFAFENGQHSAIIFTDAGTSLYGTGESAGPLLRNGRITQCWNYDAYGYDDTQANLYESHPWVLALRADGSAFGVLADTTYRVKIDLASAYSSGGSFTLSSPGPEFPLIIIERKSPQEVITALAGLVGTMALPPKWALGYHQCRYSYFPDSRVIEVAKGFRDRKIPCDVIWHDIDYMHNFLCFTFSQKHFPDPARHNADLHALGFKTVWMIDPGIAADPAKFPGGHYSVYESGTAADVWVKQADGKTTYRGEVWPGWCVFPDFTRKDTRQWWSGLYKDWIALGIDGVWNDMNEPAVFNTPDKSKTMPEDNQHRPDAAFANSKGENPGEHARWHNVYGMLMIQATRDGVMAANPGKRPFVLSRASFIGGQRYGAMWTGDNSADWYHMESSIPMVLNMGLSGQPFAGPDIGGFAGNGPAGQEGKLFARWMGFGAMMPFARAHTASGNIDKEPWAFGPEVEKTCRQAIERRYRFMPYLYTLFRETSTTGMPIARPLFFIDPKDPALRSEDDAFTLGGDLMVVAQMMPDGSRLPVLPKARDGQRWLGFDFGEGSNIDLPNLYIRPGAIIPTGPVMQHVDETAAPATPITLILALDKTGHATGTLYEDSGDGYGYTKGDYLLTTYAAALEGDTITVSVRGVEGKRPRPDRPLHVKLLIDADGPGPDATVEPISKVKILSAEGKDGQPVSFKLD